MKPTHAVPAQNRCSMGGLPPYFADIFSGYCSEMACACACASACASASASASWPGCVGQACAARAHGFGAPRRSWRLACRVPVCARARLLGPFLVLSHAAPAGQGALRHGAPDACTRCSAIAVIAQKTHRHALFAGSKQGAQLLKKWSVCCSCKKNKDLAQPFRTCSGLSTRLSSDTWDKPSCRQACG